MSQRRTRWGRRDEFDAAIGRVRATFDQTQSLKFIHERGEIGRIYVEQCRQITHRHGMIGHASQRSKATKAEPDFLTHFAATFVVQDQARHGVERLASEFISNFGLARHAGVSSRNSGLISTAVARALSLADDEVAASPMTRIATPHPVSTHHPGWLALEKEG